MPRFIQLVRRRRRLGFCLSRDTGDTRGAGTASGGRLLIRRSKSEYDMVSMATNAKIVGVDPAELRVIRYPDPRLREMSTEIEPSEIGASLAAVVERMFELMFESRGVGLAGPQVGLTIRLFVASPTFEPDDRRVYINPRLIALDGQQDGDEGCLSFPTISCRVKRYQQATISALGPDGHAFEETGQDLAARIFQHEIDHLDGRLLVDRMSTVAKLANRRALKRLEEQFA